MSNIVPGAMIVRKGPYRIILSRVGEMDHRSMCRYTKHDTKNIFIIVSIDIVKNGPLIDELTLLDSFDGTLWQVPIRHGDPEHWQVLKL